MSAKYILAATLAIVASEMALPSAHAITGEQAVKVCKQIGTNGGCIYTCNRKTGACEVYDLDSGTIISCPTQSGSCQPVNRTGKAGSFAAGSRSTVAVDGQ